MKYIALILAVCFLIELDGIKSALYSKHYDHNKNDGSLTIFKFSLTDALNRILDKLYDIESALYTADYNLHKTHVVKLQ
jgi:hypothetical protein